MKHGPATVAVAFDRPPRESAHPQCSRANCLLRLQSLRRRPQRRHPLRRHPSRRCQRMSLHASQRKSGARWSARSGSAPRLPPPPQQQQKAGQLLAASRAPRTSPCLWGSASATGGLLLLLLLPRRRAVHARTPCCVMALVPLGVRTARRRTSWTSASTSWCAETRKASSRCL